MSLADLEARLDGPSRWCARKQRKNGYCWWMRAEPAAPDSRLIQLRTLLAVYVLGAFLVFDAIFPSLPYIETAAIKIAVPPQKLQANVALNSSGLSVQHLDVEVTDTAQGTATGTLPVAPTYAYGQVRFLMVCRPTPTTPGCQPFTVRSGTVVVSVRGIRYVTTSPATLLPPPGSQTAFASIRAVGFGAGGNTGPGTIMAIENNPLPPGPSAQGVLQAFNYSAVSGGAHARGAPGVPQHELGAAPAARTAP